MKYIHVHKRKSFQTNVVILICFSLHFEELMFWKQPSMSVATASITIPKNNWYSSPNSSWSWELLGFLNVSMWSYMVITPTWNIVTSIWKFSSESSVVSTWSEASSSSWCSFASPRSWNGPRKDILNYGNGSDVSIVVSMKSTKKRIVELVWNLRPKPLTLKWPTLMLSA